MRIPPLWAQAQIHMDQVDLLPLGREHGWRALHIASEWQLIRWGIPEKAAKDLANGLGRETFGDAICMEDSRYPSQLLASPKPPPVVNVQGDATCLQQPCVAIVGTRRCTSYGAAAARQLAGGFAAAGWTIVSGLARGIDSHAHRAANEVGRTAAVLGHGLLGMSPASNRGLREEIVYGGGAVLSMWPDDYPAAKYTFPRRNAWIAWLAQLVIVVEAPVRSGALHTARHALAGGRDVAALPGRTCDPMSQGCNQLIGDGAELISSIPEFISHHTGLTIQRRERWLSALIDGMSLEAVARIRGGSITSLLEAVVELELSGDLVRLPGSRYAVGG